MQRLQVIVLTVILSVLMFFAVVWPFSPAGIQSRNLKTADRLIPNVKAALGQDERFTDFRVGRYTGGGGGMLIVGRIENQDAENDLKMMISGMDIPVHVEYVLMYTEMEEETAGSLP